MKYLDAVTQSMNMLGKEKDIIFFGYNINFGSMGYGTLKEISKNKKIETPLAENLMIGLAMGMSLEGYRPVVFFERHDFILNALDGIINHLDKIEEMSKKQYHTPVIIRATIGGKIPLNPGAQHTQDFSDAFKKMMKFQIYSPKTPEEVMDSYEKANRITKNLRKPVMIIEERDLYLNE